MSLASSIPLEAHWAQLCGTLPSHEREGQIFWKLRMRVARAQLRHLFTQARLRTSLVIVLSSFFWLGLFALFFTGFRFVLANTDGPGAPMHAQTMRLVFPLFFLSL